MADTTQVDAQIEQVRELIKIWTRFYELLRKAFGETELTERDDEAFQEIKRIIAERHDSFMKAVNKDHHIAQVILDTVKRTITIFDFPKMSDVAIDKSVIEWHDANILLYETMGALEWEHDRLLRVSTSEVRAKKTSAFMNKIKEALTSGAAKNLLGFLVLIAAIGGLCWYFREEIGRSPYYHDYVAAWWEPVYNWVAGLLGGGA